ncbi:MAG: YitT family protein, partial [Oscillospiraceae bacterium]|nr:YitT family protein [Oscillospiraceae bacterium]
MNDKFKKFLLLTAGTLITAVGIYFFKFPNNFSFGGVSGLSVVLAKVTGFTAGRINLVINMALLILGFLILGKSCGVMTAYTSILLSGVLSLLEKLVPIAAPLTDQPLLELVFAVAVPAYGTAILFNIGASSGGTDIIA